MRARVHQVSLARLLNVRAACGGRAGPLPPSLLTLSHSEANTKQSQFPSKELRGSCAWPRDSRSLFERLLLCSVLALILSDLSSSYDPIFCLFHLNYLTAGNAQKFIVCARDIFRVKRLAAQCQDGGGEAG